MEVEFRGVEKWSSHFVVPDWYKSQIVNLASKGKVVSGAKSYIESFR